jgi:hypothetical protein
VIDDTLAEIFRYAVVCGGIFSNGWVFDIMVIRINEH